MRIFDTGATRDDDVTKLDYEGCLSPVVLEAYTKYLQQHTIQADGQRRTSDNWQKGIPKDVYMKSLVRHVFVAWRLHRRALSGSLVSPQREELHDALMATMFNAMGYTFESLRNDFTNADNKTEIGR